MAKEVKQVNKLSYKLVLCLIKLLPMLSALCYLTNTILSYFGIDVPLLSLIAGKSILDIVTLYCLSYVFRFCAYHRMFIHYIVVSDIIAYYDMYVGIPVSDRSLFSINCIIAGITLFLIIYLKFKVCKKH